MVQDNQLSIPKDKTRLQKLLWFAKLSVTLLILTYIYRTFNNEQKGVADISAVLQTIWSPEHYPMLIVMVLLVPLNWALESLKWQTLVRKVTDMSFRDAFRGTLTGLAIGVALPAQLGDTVGRVAAIRSDKRLQAIGAALISNGIQFFVSVLAGAWGWFQMRGRLALPQAAEVTLNAALIATIVFGVAAFFLRKKISHWNPNKSLLKKLHSYISVIANYTSADLGTALSWGAIRYLVFLGQFTLSLMLFDFPVAAIDLLACVSLIFLAKTLIPAINVLGDLGLREFTALVVFKSFGLPAEQIIAATFLIWVINVLGPILIGIFLIWKYKWYGLLAQNRNNL